VDVDTNQEYKSIFDHKKKIRWKCSWSLWSIYEKTV